MELNYIVSTLASCIFFMSLVGWIAYQKTKGVADTKMVIFWLAGV
mgnify:CR=1